MGPNESKKKIQSPLHGIWNWDFELTYSTVVRKTGYIIKRVNIIIN